MFRCILVATATLICLTPKATEPLTVLLLSPSAYAATETHHAIQNVLTPALRDMGVVLREVPVPLDPTTTTESIAVAVRRFFETRSPFAVIAFDEARHTVHFGYRTRKGPVEVIQRVLSRIGGPESVGEAVGIIVQELVSALRLDTPDTPSTTGDDDTSADNPTAATASVAANDSDTPQTPAPGVEPPGQMPETGTGIAPKTTTSEALEADGVTSSPNIVEAPRETTEETTEETAPGEKKHVALPKNEPPAAGKTMNSAVSGKQRDAAPSRTRLWLGYDLSFFSAATAPQHGADVVFGVYLARPFALIAGYTFFGPLTIRRDINDLTEADIGETPMRLSLIRHRGQLGVRGEWVFSRVGIGASMALAFTALAITPDSTVDTITAQHTVTWQASLPIMVRFFVNLPKTLRLFFAGTIDTILNRAIFTLNRLSETITYLTPFRVQPAFCVGISASFF